MVFGQLDNCILCPCVCSRQPVRQYWNIKNCHLADIAPALCNIAHLCGFSTSAQFSKLFKDKYGITPKQFCNRHKKTT